MGEAIPQVLIKGVQVGGIDFGGKIQQKSD